jgi:hypothetical protein
MKIPNQTLLAENGEYIHLILEKERWETIGLVLRSDGVSGGYSGMISW